MGDVACSLTANLLCLYFQANATQLIKKTKMARQKTQSRAYMPTSKSVSPLEVTVRSLRIMGFR